VPDGPATQLAPRLALLKALGDNTRYAIYLELARSSVPRSTSEVAESLDLHPNTVRPHLERMREVGLLAVGSESRGGVGRPQHRYSLAADAPSLGLEPPAMPLLARLLLQVSAVAGATPEESAEVGRQQGRAAVAAHRGGACVEALVAELDQLGYDPALASDGEGTTIAFTHCPFAELAAAHPEVVCELHRGIVEGFLESASDVTVERFGTLVARHPCSVDLVTVDRTPLQGGAKAPAAG